MIADQISPHCTTIERFDNLFLEESHNEPPSLAFGKLKCLMDNGLRSYSFVTMILIRPFTSKISLNRIEFSLWIIPLYLTEIEKPHFCPVSLCFDHRLSGFLFNIIRQASF